MTDHHKRLERAERALNPPPPPKFRVQRVIYAPSVRPGQAHGPPRYLRTLERTGDGGLREVPDGGEKGR